MITRPLELEPRLSPPPRDLDFVAWVNVAVIVLFFSLLGSRFVLAPGLLVAVGDPGPGQLELPRYTGAVEGTEAASVVVSYREDNVILFEGGMYTLQELRKPMANYAKQHRDAVMLVQPDGQGSVQGLVNLILMARAVGFANVLLAGEPQPLEGPLPRSAPNSQTSK
jgi:biopolymer transport protein ExbD